LALFEAAVASATVYKSLNLCQALFGRWLEDAFLQDTDSCAARCHHAQALDLADEHRQATIGKASTMVITRMVMGAAERVMPDPINSLPGRWLCGCQPKLRADAASCVRRLRGALGEPASLRGAWARWVSASAMLVTICKAGVPCERQHCGDPGCAKSGVVGRGWATDHCHADPWKSFEQARFDLRLRARVEVTGRFVGQRQSRLCHHARAMPTRCCFRHRTARSGTSPRGLAIQPLSSAARDAAAEFRPASLPLMISGQRDVVEHRSSNSQLVQDHADRAARGMSRA